MGSRPNLFLFLQVLQQQLIKAERERILQQIQSGAVTADTGKKMLRKIDEGCMTFHPWKNLSPNSWAQNTSFELDLARYLI